MWRIEPDGPHPAWETMVDVVALLRGRGEHARAERWLNALARVMPDKAAELRTPAPGPR